VLDSLFGEANAEAMDAELDPEPAADSVGMDVRDDAAAVVADGGMIVDDDDSHCVRPTVRAPTPFLPHSQAVKTLTEKVMLAFLRLVERDVPP
jgi:hypothetical protein